MGNEKEEAEREEARRFPRPGFWTFSRNIALDEIRYYKNAIRALKGKAREAMENSEKTYGNLSAEEYIKGCRRAVKDLKTKIEKAELDLKILEKNKKHRMFKNTDERYNDPII
eukprot:TRINITY_DN7314_c0_g1_i3.p1 TRINITY_DN7314_c0_g1~~TRINITY_DN7314_c0_g1_i3.p1  ORF type:complete len:113 (+),score=32.84 TRINITY_DN7314_c0_g1_i3:115-453(+)